MSQNHVESDGIDEALQGVTQVAMTAAGRIGEQIARSMEQQARLAQAQSERAAAEMAERVRAERNAARAALAPVHEEAWWDHASAQDIAKAYETAKTWRDVDPDAARAEQRIVEQSKARFGLDLPVPDLVEKAPRFTIREFRNEADFSREITRDEALSYVQRVDPNTHATLSDVSTWIGKDAEIDAVIEDRFSSVLSPWARDALEAAKERRAAQERTDATLETAEAVGLVADADALDRRVEEEVERMHEAVDRGDVQEVDHHGAEADHAQSQAGEKREQAGHLYDSAERRQETAQRLDHIENRAAVEARMTADVAQGRPATDAVSQAPGRAPKPRPNRKTPQAARRTQRGMSGR